MRPLGIALRRWRMRRILKRHPIPHHIWQSVSRRVFLLRGLDAVQMARLRDASFLSGESWLRGPVILSWDEVERDIYQRQTGQQCGVA